MNHCRGAHRAGFNRHIEYCFIQPIIFKSFTCFSKNQDFCMGCRIVQRDAAIMPPRQYTIAPSPKRSPRELLRLRQPGLLPREPSSCIAHRAPYLPFTSPEESSSLDRHVPRKSRLLGQKASFEQGTSKSLTSKLTNHFNKKQK